MITPLRTYINITDECNLSCIHCYKNKNMKKELTLNEIKKIFHEISISSAYPQITLTGGEPLLHSKFKEILDCSNQFNLMLDLSTNGMLLDSDIIKLLEDTANLVYLQISLDGSNSNIHDEIRGQGSFEIIYKNLKILSKSDLVNRIDLNLVSIINSINMDDIANIVKIAEEFGFSKVSFGEVIPIGMGKKNYKHLGLTKTNLNKIYNIINKLRDKTIIPIISQFTFGFLFDPLFRKSRCTADECETIYINTNGNVIICPYFISNSQVIGNIFEKSYDKILMSRNTDKVTCENIIKKDCEYLNKCIGGCRLLKENWKEETLICDPRCVIYPAGSLHWLKE